MSKPKILMKKICVIGEAAVGKTSLIKRFVLDKFSDRYIATIGTKTSAKELNISIKRKEYKLKIQIWDIIGLRSFAKLQRHAYKGANGAFFVTDITRKETLYTFDSWLLSLYEVAGEIPVVVLANKKDLKANFGETELEQAIKEYGFPYLFTSAKTGENVNEAFLTLGKMMIRPRKKKNIMPMLKKSIELEKALEPELAPGRSFSIFEVEDIIMARYCDLLEDPNFAMALINEQYLRAGINFKDPTVERLNWIVDNLIKAAATRVEPSKLEKEFEAYTNLIKLIG